MRINTLAQKLSLRADNEVAFDAGPHEMELILIEPHILPRAGDSIRLGLGIIASRARILGHAYVGLRIEETYLVRSLATLRAFRSPGRDDCDRNDKDVSYEMQCQSSFPCGGVIAIPQTRKGSPVAASQPTYMRMLANRSPLRSMRW